MGRTTGNHFRFGVCDNALAAADFAALLAFGLLSTLLAALAALALVCRVFRLAISLTSDPRGDLRFQRGWWSDAECNVRVG